MAIAETVSRNVTFKVAKMRDSIMEDQNELIIRKSECEELGSEAWKQIQILRLCWRTYGITQADLLVYRQSSRGQHAKLGT